MDKILDILQKHGRTSAAEIAEMVGETEEEVAERIRVAEHDGTILGYQAVLDKERLPENGVTALIEVRVTPEREGGFDRLAKRISKFDQVQSCFLMSGSYDLLVVVEGHDLREVARFVAEKLSTLDGVLSTATHFRLKIYKQMGFLAEIESEPERLPVSP